MFSIILCLLYLLCLSVCGLRNRKIPHFLILGYLFVTRKCKRLPLLGILIASAVIPVHAQDTGASASISRTDDKYSCSIRKEPFTSVIDTLFKKGKREYALISKPNISLENMSYSDKDFDSLLSVILLQCNCDYTVNDGVYYIYEIQKKDAVKRLKETRVIHLENISIETLMSLIPNELNASAFIKQDKNGNSIVLTGSPSEINPIEEFVRQIDVKDDKRQHRSIRLKYIKSDELLKNLPPSVTKGNITETNQPEIVFFSGTENQYEKFLEELALMDQPRQQIKYQLLVIQRQKTEGLNWGTSLSAGSTDKESGYSWTGMISNIFNINFDIISQFGVQFAGSLNAELSEGKSRVLADTTLNGLSGEQVNFSNTNTYRYTATETLSQSKMPVERLSPMSTTMRSTCSPQKYLSWERAQIPIPERLNTTLTRRQRSPRPTAEATP